MADVDVHADPTTVNVLIPNPINATLTDTLTLSTPAPLQTRAEIVLPQPLQTASTVTLVLPQPFQTDSKAQLDILPVAADLCLNVAFARLPPACIRFPTEQHVGLTLFGVEIFGVNVAGESRIVVEDVSPKPQVAWGGDSTMTPHVKPRLTVQPVAETPMPVTGGGLRIRLGR